MNFLMRILGWMGRVLLPVRLRPSSLQVRLQAALDKTVTGVEKGAARAGTAAERVEGGEPPKHGRAGIIFRWIVHFLIIAAILVLLYFVNQWLQLERVLRSDWPVLHPYWLPMIFLLLYLMTWFAWWIWELTGPEKLTNDFPDIDQAWKEAVRSAADSGVDLRDVPVFLVLGRPTEGEDNLLLAAQFGFLVREVPRWPEAPLRLSCNRDGAFVTCAGASVLGKHVALLVEEIREALSAGERLPGAGDVTAEAVAAPGGEGDAAPVAGIQQILGQAQEEGRGPDQLTEEERRVIGLLVAEEEAEKPAALSRRRVFLKNKAEIQEMMARLQHVCQLIARYRRPFCPINGILVLLPFAATDTDEDAAQATTACQLDLSVVRETMQVQCPIFTIACDVEKAPGFREFLRRMPASQRDRRMGQRFPLLPDVETNEVPEVVQDGINWFSHTFLPALVYNLFRLEASANGQVEAGSLPDPVAGNTRLYQFLSEMRLRRQRLTRFLTRGLLLDSPPSFYFGGLYLAGTGPDAERDRGFVSGVFQRLPENQNYVTWTPEAQEQEAEFQRWTRYGYILLLVLLGAIAFLVYRLWFR